jgi:hypothetical protein
MSSQITPQIRPGDIVSFRFPYKEGLSPYARPSLVLETTEDEILLAYGTTSRERANVGFEIRLNADFAACGLDMASRFVLARRVRVKRDDPRFECDSTGNPAIGQLPDDLVARKQTLLSLIAQSWETPAQRHHAERGGIHPPKGRRRRRANRLVPCL